MKQIKLWDLATRLFHWSLVISFALVTFSAFQDKIMTGYDTMHRQAGIMILILVLFRIFWGLVGSGPSRFSSFVKGPSAIKAYVRGEYDKNYVGHNPMGAYSLVAMLMLLLAQGILGLFSTDGILFSGPLSELAPDAERLTLIHRWLGYTLMGLVGLHILTIIFYKVVKKEGLLKAMITGNKETEAAQPIMKSQFLALGLFFIAGAIVCGTVFIIFG